MELNCYKVTTPFNTYFLTAWTLAEAVLNFTKRDDLFTEVSEADKEYMIVEPASEEDLEGIRIRNDKLKDIVAAYVSFELEAIISKED